MDDEGGSRDSEWTRLLIQVDGDTWGYRLTCGTQSCRGGGGGGSCFTPGPGALVVRCWVMCLLVLAPGHSLMDPGPNLPWSLSPSVQTMLWLAPPSWVCKSTLETCPQGSWDTIGKGATAGATVRGRVDVPNPLLTGAMQVLINFSGCRSPPQWPPRGLSVAHAGSRVLVALACNSLALCGSAAGSSALGPQL